MKNIRINLPLFVFVLFCAVSSRAQQDIAREAMESEFYFARVAFGVDGGRYGGGRNEPWLRDWPEAEHHFMQGVRRLTRIDAADVNRQVSLTDDAIFDYPVIYEVYVEPDPFS